MEERINMRGQLTLLWRDRQGRVIHQQRYQNRIVTSGRRMVATLFAGTTSNEELPTRISHIAIGTGSNPPSDNDLALQNEIVRKPIDNIAFSELVEGEGEARVQRIQVGLRAVLERSEANSAEPLREAGIFNAEAGGTLYNRVVFAPVTKTDNFELTLLWDVIF